MSVDNHPPDTDSASDDVWKQFAEYREVLEMCVEEDVPFANQAEMILERIEEEGY